MAKEEKVVCLKEMPTKNGFFVYRENLTGFMYFSSSKYSIVPLFDPDGGKPLTFERYKELLGEDQLKGSYSYDSFYDYEE
ncbi:hypothetical protein IJG79_02695 [Candidatus Saccharibacteria bacterium]|nr:hypothetical protein [Candidatus Saccharibacteria bacterium]